MIRAGDRKQGINIDSIPYGMVLTNAGIGFFEGWQRGALPLLNLALPPLNF